MFRQDDLSQFFLGNSGPLKRQNEQRTQYFRDYEKSKHSRQFLKEWKQNRPWLVDTETGMVCSYCKEQKQLKFIYYRMYKLQTSTPYVKL
jgi:excinuclease UvrABC nuclease subunit